MTWHSEWIAWSEKFLLKSFWASSLRKRTEGGIEEDEEAERQCEIGFREGFDFLGAMDKKLNQKKEEKENMNTAKSLGKKERKNYAW